MGESRVELIAWVNELLGLGYTKVEQLGSGTVSFFLFSHFRLLVFPFVEDIPSRPPSWSMADKKRRPRRRCDYELSGLLLLGPALEQDTEDKDAFSIGGFLLNLAR